MILRANMPGYLKLQKETIEAGKKNGPFIIQSADFLEWGTPEENVKAYVDTALENSGY